MTSIMTNSLKSTRVNSYRKYHVSMSKADLVLKFKTDKEGLALANKYKNLIKNPNIQLTIKFLKVE